MHYVALVAGKERQVEILEIAPGRYELTIDGKTREFEAKRISAAGTSLILGERSYHIELDCRSKGTGKAYIRGRGVDVEVLDLRSMHLKRAQRGAEGVGGPAVIASPMPGKIVDVLVKEGQHVKEGEGLIIVEAMKMENELKSPKAGTVAELKAKKGEAVDGGKALCVIV